MQTTRAVADGTSRYVYARIHAADVYVKDLQQSLSSVDALENDDDQYSVKQEEEEEEEEGGGRGGGEKRRPLVGPVRIVCRCVNTAVDHLPLEIHCSITAKTTPASTTLTDILNITHYHCTLVVK